MYLAIDESDVKKGQRGEYEEDDDVTRPKALLL